MKRVRFKTEAEFKSAGHWRHQYNKPVDWSDSEMHLLGKEITCPKALKLFEQSGYNNFYLDEKYYYHVDFVILPDDAPETVSIIKKPKLVEI